MRAIRIMAVVIAVICLTAACMVQRKTSFLESGQVSVSISMSQDSQTPELSLGGLDLHDTVEVEDADGRKYLLMKAVKDENGEMSASDVISPAYVTARFRNVAERQGHVDLRFQISVPQEMQDSRWQLRFTPHLQMLNENLDLEKVIITGKDYRKTQLRGYQQYERFLQTIVTDSLLFVSQHQLEVFLQRNIPQVLKYRTDTSYVSDEQFASSFGVTELQAVEHYTIASLVRRNERRKEKKEKMFNKFVKAPIISESLRLDTVIRSANGDFIYEYVQEIAVGPRMRKAEITLSGDIFEQDKRIWTIPTTEPLTFYISSLSGLADETQRYLTKVIEREVKVNTTCYIDFSSGSSDIDHSLSNNASEIRRIKDNIRSLISNGEYEMDSITVTASCSPEGAYDFNSKLAALRSETVCCYFDSYLNRIRDSIRRESDIGTKQYETSIREKEAEISFISRSNPENWEMLDALALGDSTLSNATVQAYKKLMAEPDPDLRERKLSLDPSYTYFQEMLYPKLRTVKFGFHMHRRDMEKDTIHTTVLDSTYATGVLALKDMDYPKAVALLRPYGDYNAAVALCAMDYNASAMDILQKLKSSGPVEYLMAIICSRNGEPLKAVQHYLNACSFNEAYIHRGNLDPEISALIKTYGLNAGV